MAHEESLPAGTELGGDYRIDSVLGIGGFGITYRASDTRLRTDVAIKEYFPGDFARRKETINVASRSVQSQEDYDWGLERFMQEAQTLARFKHPNIVRVSRVFQENNTAYMVLDYEEGRSLSQWLRGLGRTPSQDEIDALLEPLLDALKLIHANNFLHRDIAPDNIYVRADGSPVLLDFGSARQAIEAHTQGISALVKAGYSPPEQFATRADTQGPWSDIYAMAATLYRAVSGNVPPESTTRMFQDDMVSAVDAARGNYRRDFLEAIDDALAPRPDERPQTVEAWKAKLFFGGDARTGAPDSRSDTTPRPRVVVDQEEPPETIVQPLASPPPPPEPAPPPPQPASANETGPAADSIAGAARPRYALRVEWLLHLLFGAAIVFFLSEQIYLSFSSPIQSPDIVAPGLWFAGFALIHAFRFWRSPVRREAPQLSGSAIGARSLGDITWSWLMLASGLIAIQIINAGTSLVSGVLEYGILFTAFAALFWFLSRLMASSTGGALSVLVLVLLTLLACVSLWIGSELLTSSEAWLDVLTDNFGEALFIATANIFFDIGPWYRIFCAVMMLCIAFQSVLGLVNTLIARRDMKAFASQNAPAAQV